MKHPFVFSLLFFLSLAGAAQTTEPKRPSYSELNDSLYNPYPQAVRREVYRRYTGKDTFSFKGLSPMQEDSLFRLTYQNEWIFNNYDIPLILLYLGASDTTNEINRKAYTNLKTNRAARNEQLYRATQYFLTNGWPKKSQIRYARKGEKLIYAVAKKGKGDKANADHIKKTWRF